MDIHSVTVNLKTVSNDELEGLELNTVKIDTGHYQCLHDQKSYKTKVQQIDLENKQVTLLINGQIYECSIKEEIDALISEMSLTTSKKKVNKNLISSMPGLVLKLNVAEGDSITAGDPLMILEAMKMENVLSADADGVIKAIHCSEGDAVEKRQLLIEIE